MKSKRSKGFTFVIVFTIIIIIVFTLHIKGIASVLGDSFITKENYEEQIISNNEAENIIDATQKLNNIGATAEDHGTIMILYTAEPDSNNETEVTAAEAPVAEAPSTVISAPEATASKLPAPVTPGSVTPVVATPVPQVPLTNDQAFIMAQQNADSYNELASEVSNLINQERMAVGVASLVYDNTLTIAAMHRSAENAWMNWLTVSDGHHIRPNGENASTICDYYGLYGNFGENLGRYQSNPTEIVAGWYNSQAHYNCMINTKYTKVGIGIAKDSDGFFYWTAIFM